MHPRIIKFAKEILFNTPLRKFFFPRYFYNFTAPQLCFLCSCIEETRDVAGAIAEVGCAEGTGTVFMNKYLDAQNIEKEYFAVDTFAGFVAEDVEFEISKRGKTEDMFNEFQRNKKKWFDGTMEQNGIQRVRSVEADVNEYDLTKLGPLSFVLLDVDLYRPIKKALNELYEVLSPGGIIVVDDCDLSDVRWDGSDQAYKEFVKEREMPEQIVHGKLGVIKKSV